MKNIFIILTIAMSACTDDPGIDCDGFSGEPSLIFTGTKPDTFGIFFLNQTGNGDTVFSYNGEPIEAPVDMASDTMFYEIIGDSSLGQLVLSYELEQRLCASTDELKQYFLEARFTPQSEAKHVSTVIEGSKLSIDTTAGYASFLNQSLTNRYFEIDL